MDFIGTYSFARRRSLGANLLTADIDGMLSMARTKKLSLTANADNGATRTLDEWSGFDTEQVMRGNRMQFV